GLLLEPLAPAEPGFVAQVIASGPTARYSELIDQSEKLCESCRPAFREVQVLRLRDLQLRLKRREAQRHNESIVTNFLCCLDSDSDFIADPLFLHTIGRGNQQYLGGLVADGVLKNALPIVAAAQAQNVSKHGVIERRQLGAEPQREGVILRT